MPSKVYQFNFNKGYAYSLGSGFGATSLTGVNYINFPEGYAYLRGLIFREDGVLRPMYGGTSCGSVGSSAPYSISAGEVNNLYVIASDRTPYYSTNEGTTWNDITWSGAGSEPQTSTGKFKWAVFANDTVVFTDSTATNPVYVIQTT